MRPLTIIIRKGDQKLSLHAAGNFTVVEKLYILTVER